MTWWIVGLGLLAVAALSVYVAFRSPAFVAGLTALATAAAWKVIKPAILKPEAPEDRAARQEAYRRADGDGDWRRKSKAPPKG